MVPIRERLGGWTAAVQGVYYVITGLWPLLHLESFLAVTGPKDDLWLVQTVGVLVLVVGVALLVAAFDDMRPMLAIYVLGIGAAAAFIAVDVVFYLDGRIGAIYLLDAAAHGVLLIGWAVAGLSSVGTDRSPVA